jgi:rRNA biogenesis protein RRP5
MASAKRKSNAAELSNTKSSIKRPRTEVQLAHSETSDQRGAGNKLKPGKASLISTGSVPTSLLTNEQPAFPRGGSSILTPIERKQIQAQATRDALQEHASSGDLFSTSHEALDKSDDNDGTQDASKRLKKKRKKHSNQKSSNDGMQDKLTPRIEGLSFKVSLLLLICFPYLT